MTVTFQIIVIFLQMPESNVKIESNCFIGSSATIRESITIKNSFIRAGSLAK